MKKTVYCDKIGIGGNNVVTVQSMLNTKLSNIDKSLAQLQSIELNGCDIIRASVDDEDDAKAIKVLKPQINMPLIADIQFDYKMALAAIANDVSGIRINPGNIGSEAKVREIVAACKDKNIPIRVGVNSGSIKREYLEKYKGVNKYSLVESALEQVGIIEKFNYDNIVISIKASDTKLNFEANTELYNRTDYPLHIGITESGSDDEGIIKSSVGLGSLLMNGIGDTIRVSLTDDPVKEVITARRILQFAGIRPYGIEIVSCPTCGRTKVDLISIVKEVKKHIGSYKKNIKVAIMGCAVNGPGEAKEADIGIAGGNGEALLFKKGVIIKKIKESEIISTLIEEIEKIEEIEEI